MKYIILDTETSDLNGEVIQMAFMVVNEDLDIEMFESFYCNTEQIISDGAFNVHHISNKMLKELSGGKWFEDYLLKDYKKVFFDKGRVFTGFNIPYDLKRINYTLEYTGLSLPAVRTATDLRRLDDNLVYSFDLMKTCRRKFNQIKGINLKECTDRLVSGTLDVDEVYKYYCKKYGIRTSGNGYHDASYDVVCTYLLLVALSDEVC